MRDDQDFTDDLGPWKVIHLHEPESGLKAALVVDNVAAGPSIGGLRMAVDVSVRECFRLARAMTLKNAAAGLPHGGGKSVLFGDPRMPKEQKERLIRTMASSLRGEEAYIFGPDMGTNEECMAWVHDEIGRAVGLPRELGGIPLDELGATGWGLCHAAEVAARFCALDLAGARVVVQGFGSVGMHAARFLAEQGARLVAATDSKGGIEDASGLDIDALIALKKLGGSLKDASHGHPISTQSVIDVACDVWIPAARPDVIDGSNVDRLNARLVVQGANIPITSAAEQRLHDRDVLCVPDFIANAGGVICAAMEYRGVSERAAFDAIEERVRRNTEQMLKASRDQGITPREAATSMALDRVRKAMGTRRYGLYSAPS